MKEIRTIRDTEDFRIINYTVESVIMDTIRGYINNLRGKYAGVSHIDLLCSFLKYREFDEENPTYSRERAGWIIRKWMVSSIAQWLNNIPNEVMLTFVQSGEITDIEKLCQFIIPEPLIDHSIFARENNDTDFDLADIYTRHAFIIHDELFPLKDLINTWKMITSISELPSKRDDEEFCVKHKIIGVPLATSNRNQENGGFLLRSFGYRRFGCIELEGIENGYSKAIDVDQMWAEAFMLCCQLPELIFAFDWNDYRDFEKYNAKYMIQ